MRHPLRHVQKIWRKAGPGLITGASDDDPSGIATYSQAGAAFGFGTLWTAPFTFPLMAAIQEMCARIGMVTSMGLTGTLKKHYHPMVLYTMLLFSFPAIIINIAADIAGMGAVGNLIIPEIDADWFGILFTLLLLASIIYFPYKKIAMLMKYLCISLLVYVAIPFLSDQDWTNIFHESCFPDIHATKEYIAMLTAIFGTTLSPYLFFWQAHMEVEHFQSQKKETVIDKRLLHGIRKEVWAGMFYSNLIMFFIILTTGSVLHVHGIRQIETVEQAAAALQPLAGKHAYLLFASGVIGTGFLAIPVLCGSLSYILCETFGWEMGLDKKFHEARPFYLIIIVSMIVGLLLNQCGISPIKALVYSAILYGITAPVLIAIILHIANREEIMKGYRNNLLSNFLGVIALAVMTLCALFLLYLQLK